MDIKSFLVNNWYVITYVIISVTFSIITIIFTIRKNRKAVDITNEVKETLLESLPIYISFAEQLGNSSESKKLTAIKLSLDCVEHQLGRKLNDDEIKFYEAFVSPKIENILSTPQKKGVQDGKKNEA